MATAYSVMSQAKRQGAETRALENYEKYMAEVRAEEARASKAMSKGKLGGAIGGSITSFLIPALLTAASATPVGIGAMLGTAAISALLSKGGIEGGDWLARQWSMGGGKSKEFQDYKIGEMEGISGPYGQRYAELLKSGSKKEMEKYREDIDALIDIEQSQRWLSSAMSGLRASGKARSGAEALKGVEDATLGERMMAGIEGDVGEGYKLGATSTGDWWRKPEFTDISKMSPSAPLSLQTGHFGAKTSPFEEGYDYFETGTSPLVKDRTLGESLVSSGFSPEDTSYITPSFAPLSASEAPIAATMPTAAPSSIPASFGQQGGMTAYSPDEWLSSPDIYNRDRMGSLLDALLQRSKPTQNSPLLQQLLQGGY